MKIVFTYKDGESLAIEYLSAVLKENGHTTSLIFESYFLESEYINIPFLRKRADRPAKVAARIVGEKPDMVAFSVVSDHYQWACAVAEEVKKMCDAPIVFGGMHVTAVPRRVIRKPFIDYVVVGEGEFALLDLANALESNGGTENIPNVWRESDGTIIENKPRPPVPNLDSLPPPDRSIFTEKVPIYKEIYYAMSGRGCPYACTYCCNSLLQKIYKGQRFQRKRSLESMVEELREAFEREPFKMVYFLDDDFVSDRKWLRKFLELYKEQVGVIFRCIGSARYVDDEVATMLAEAGCQRIQMGVQTWNEGLKRKICRRNETNEQIVKSCEAVKRSGIFLDLDYIFGLPLHDEADYIDAISQFSRVAPDNINCFWLRYYPGTEIVDIARSLDLLSDRELEEIEEGVGKAYLQGGSVKNTEPLAGIEALFKLIPFLKPKTIQKLLEREWIRWLPKSFALFIIAPRLIQMPFHKDMWYVFKRRVMEFPPFRR